MDNNCANLYGGRLCLLTFHERPSDSALVGYPCAYPQNCEGCADYKPTSTRQVRNVLVRLTALTDPYSELAKLVPHPNDGKTFFADLHMESGKLYCALRHRGADPAVTYEASRLTADDLPPCITNKVYVGDDTYDLVCYVMTSADEVLRVYNCLKDDIYDQTQRRE